MNLTHLQAQKLALHDVIADHMAPPVGRPSHLQSLMIGRSSFNHRYTTADNSLTGAVVQGIRSYLQRYFKIADPKGGDQVTNLSNRELTTTEYHLAETIQYDGGEISTFFFYVSKKVHELTSARPTGGDISGRAGMVSIPVDSRDPFDTFEMILFGSSRNNAFSITCSDPNFKEKHHAFFEQFLSPKSHSVTILDIKGAEQTMTITSNKIKTHDEFFPYLGGSVEQLITDYYQSQSSVLIFTGPAGTGKSSLMRSFLNHAPKDMTFYMVDNPVVYEDPESFSGLIQRIRSQAINGPITIFMEEADKLLVSDKKTDMGSMGRLLSLSSGLVEVNVKIVAASNLENASKINENLIRHGRTYRVVEFQKLSPAQANVARSALNKDALDFEHDITLAHALNATDVSKESSRTRAGFGFSK